MKNTNKGRRIELRNLKFKQRLVKHRITPEALEKWKFHNLREQGKPCSCWMCRGEKYRDKDRRVNKQELLNIEM